MENSIKRLAYSEKDTVFKNIYQVAKEFERHFSKLSFIKTKFKRAMFQYRLEA